MSWIVAMLYVQKDLGAIVKAVFDRWEERKGELNHQYLFAADARVTPTDILHSIKKRAFSCFRCHTISSQNRIDRQGRRLPCNPHDRCT